MMPRQKEVPDTPINLEINIHNLQEDIQDIVGEHYRSFSADKHNVFTFVENYCSEGSAELISELKVLEILAKHCDNSPTLVSRINELKARLFEGAITEYVKTHTG